jgi:hypothetical protein
MPFLPLGAVLRAFCPCGLVRHALKFIFRGVRIGADRVKVTILLGVQNEYMSLWYKGSS